eukprot:3483314-Rhodomonas_salina.1
MLTRGLALACGRGRSLRLRLSVAGPFDTAISSTRSLLHSPGKLGSSWLGLSHGLRLEVNP